MRRIAIYAVALYAAASSFAQYPDDMDPRAAAAPVTTVQTAVVKDVTPESEILCIEGLEAIDNGETELGRELLEKAAEMSNPTAIYNLAVQYLKGINGFPQSDAEAYRWFKKGYENGDAESAYMLGMMTYRGQGVAQDDAVALEYFKFALKAGHPRARKMVDQLSR